MNFFNALIAIVPKWTYTLRPKECVVCGMSCYT
jgi:hypothetical protein